MALRVLLVLLVLGTLLVPLESPGCGPFLPEIQFTAERFPEAPQQFAAGNLGILQPSYQRMYQVIAYRYLTGVGLNAAEQRAVQPPPGPLPVAAPVPQQMWLTARNKVPGVAPLRNIDPYRQVKKDGFFDTYLNCNDDAFRTAISTLERTRRAGAAADWIGAQDIVFGDCSKGSDLPAMAAEPRAAKDRAYQIASAKFYSEQYAGARQDFQTIAADRTSPWHDIAPYLAARCLIRDGKFAEAERDLQRMADDPALSNRRASAISLLGYVRTRLNPQGRMHELALALVKPASQTTIAQDLTDYRLLSDRRVQPQPSDDLTDWIASFHAGGVGALEKWRANPSLPWLVAALNAAKPGDPALPELLAAATAVQPNSPAFLTVNYHRVRLLPTDEARALANQLLTGKLLIADRNMLRAQSLRMARDFDEFLRFAPRAEVRDANWALYDPQPALGSAPSGALTKLDRDSSRVLDRDVPLSLLKQAATSARLPVALQQRLQSVVATRTLLLSPAPDFAQVFRILKTPGESPFVRDDVSPRLEKPDILDNYRDNWWCAGSTPTYYRGRDEGPPPVADFLTPALREEADTEWKKLAALPTAPNWLGEQTLAFAEKNPKDPRIPEALYRVVRSTRLGCTDRGTGAVSKSAFDLLHSRYPTSEWTKKTPYWFKSND